MCTVHIRGHEANIYEAEARCHEVEIEAKARVRPRPNDLASRPRRPRGLNIPVRDNINSQKYVWIILLKMTFWIPKVKWLHLTGEVDNSLSFSCPIFSRFNMPKILKIGKFLTESFKK